MKKLFTIILTLLLSIVVFGQQKLYAPLGLSFGGSIQASRQVLDKLGTFDKITNPTYGKALIYTDIKVGSTKADAVVAKFVNNKLFEVGFLYGVEDNNIESVYEKLCKIISDKYGEGHSYRLFTDPYFDGDGYFMQALKVGKLNISTFWSSRFSNSDAIWIEIETSGIIALSYQDGKLLLEAIELNNSKDNASF